MCASERLLFIKRTVIPDILDLILEFFALISDFSDERESAKDVALESPELTESVTLNSFSYVEQSKSGTSFTPAGKVRKFHQVLLLFPRDPAVLTIISSTRGEEMICDMTWTDVSADNDQCLTPTFLVRGSK